MLIDLLTITKNGVSYDFDEFSPETDGAFIDLIGRECFNIHVKIKPMADAYKISGKLSSCSMEICSHCGYNIHCPLESFINEFIIVEKQRPRNTQVSQSSRNFDSNQPSVTYLNKPQLDLKEFLHEIMAFSMEPFPVCKDLKICQFRQFHRKEKNTNKPIGHPSFALLKDFKVKF